MKAMDENHSLTRIEYSSMETTIMQFSNGADAEILTKDAVAEVLVKGTAPIDAVLIVLKVSENQPRKYKKVRDTFVHEYGLWKQYVNFKPLD